jgi:hypothetical protein
MAREQVIEFLVREQEPVRLKSIWLLVINPGIITNPRPRESSLLDPAIVSLPSLSYKQWD